MQFLFSKMEVTDHRERGSSSKSSVARCLLGTVPAPRLHFKAPTACSSSPVLSQPWTCLEPTLLPTQSTTAPPPSVGLALCPLRTHPLNLV